VGDDPYDELIDENDIYGVDSGEWVKLNGDRSVTAYPRDEHRDEKSYYDDQATIERNFFKHVGTYEISYDGRFLVRWRGGTSQVCLV